MQRRLGAVDLRGVKRSSRRALPPAIREVLAACGPSYADGGRTYRALAYEVQLAVAFRHGIADWGTFDIASYMKKVCRTGRDRVELCCNLSALFACVCGTPNLSRQDARRHWTTLRRLCPRSEVGDVYFGLGLVEAA